MPCTLYVKNKRNKTLSYSWQMNDHKDGLYIHVISRVPPISAVVPRSAMVIILCWTLLQRQINTSGVKFHRNGNSKLLHLASI